MKTIVLGITGGVAAFKSVQLASDLVKMGYDVEVIMSKNATQFIQPLQFESLTRHKVMVDTFDRNFEYATNHISIAKKADLFIVAPATANFIAKVANGIADDMLTTTFLACNCKKYIAVAMNSQMLANLATQRNLKQCQLDGIEIISSVEGHLACGDVGSGKMADIETILKTVLPVQTLAGKKVLITLGATQEAIDPVRFITNHSTGKMGLALANVAYQLGAEVLCVAASTTVTLPSYLKVIPVKSATEMLVAVQAHYDICDICIKSAAVSDYRVKQVAHQKIKKKEENLSLELVKNPDILKWCGEHKNHQLLVGFAMETEHLIENAKQKCITKNCDFLVANSISETGSGFKGDTNHIYLIDSQQVEEFPTQTKEECAKHIFKRILKEMNLC